MISNSNIFSAILHLPLSISKIRSLRIGDKGFFSFISSATTFLLSFPALISSAQKKVEVKKKLKLKFRRLPFSVVRTFPVKFQYRERGIELCRSRNQHLFRVRLGKDTFWAERCGQDRLGGRALRPHGQLYPCLTYKIHVQN